MVSTPIPFFLDSPRAKASVRLLRLLREAKVDAIVSLSPALVDWLEIQITLLEKSKLLLKSVDEITKPYDNIVGTLAIKEIGTKRAKIAANALHDKPDGARAKQNAIKALWATGKFTSRDLCAEQECAALNMSFSSARKALRNTPNP